MKVSQVSIGGESHDSISSVPTYACNVNNYHRHWHNVSFAIVFSLNVNVWIFWKENEFKIISFLVFLLFNITKHGTFIFTWAFKQMCASDRSQAFRFAFGFACENIAIRIATFIVIQKFDACLILGTIMPAPNQIWFANWANLVGRLDFTRIQNVIVCQKV